MSRSRFRDRQQATPHASGVATSGLGLAEALAGERWSTPHGLERSPE